ncbi:cell surface glycoprotein [Tieghemostelium lacteum]|uniref:Cell surface glycoprotein n=1 Tax=Tieghemostelium lacteum TaxID=361077 RepID=A0A151ZI23_TIELA|nr:cell surface glycoprotein [Tieghemostelium lacteum]|eukprot:KYQ93616.1 cell surface glycoprotein [Tieghemostelium lacteum]
MNRINFGIISTLLILLNFTNVSYGVLDTIQSLALDALKNEYEQIWDLSNPCYLNPATITCDTTQSVVTYLTFDEPTNAHTLTNTSIFALVNLTYLSIPYRMFVGDEVWNQLYALTHLETFQINYINYAVPANVGTYFPASLYNFYVGSSSVMFPETIFTKTHIKEISIGNNNGEEYSVYPTIISSPSVLEQITVVTYGSFNLSGTNFNSLKRIIMTHKSQATYNLYNTFPVIENIEITIDASVWGNAFFPTSVLQIPTLKTLKINDLDKFQSSVNVLNFTLSPLLDDLYLDKIGSIVPSLVYPGIVVSPQSKVSLSIYNTALDLINYAFADFYTINLKSITYTGSFQEPDMSKVVKFIMEDGDYALDIPYSFCQIQNGIMLTNTPVTGLPTCFICDWGGGTSTFNGNTALPAYSQTCPSQLITGNTRLIDTAGGKMHIEGVDLGYHIYNQFGTQYATDIELANFNLSFLVMGGTGKNLTQFIKLHFDADNSVPTISLPYSYYPPLLSGFQSIGPKSVRIVGKYFGSSVGLVGVEFAGYSVLASTVTQTGIDMVAGSVPYTKDLTLSVKVIVDDQTTVTVLTPHGYNPIMSSPLPVLFSTGGLAEFSGQYLTYDTTIMNMTVNGLLFSNNITDSTSTVLIIKYDPIPSGSYNFVYNQNGYQLVDTITVKDPPSSGSPCKGTPVCGGPQQGQCINSHCECLNGWLGEQCDSKPIAIPPPLEPDTTQPSFIASKDDIALHVSIQSIRELSFDGTQLREQPIEQWTFSQNTTDEKKRYIYDSKLFIDCTIQVTVDYFLKDSIVSFAGQNSTKLAGSIKYSANITNWPFTQKTNQLQLIFSSIIQDQSSSSSSCSYKAIEYEDNQTKDSIKKVNIQVNGNTFSTEFSGLAVIDGINRKIKNSLVPTSEEDTNTQSTSLVGITTPYHNEYIIIDPDFSLLVSYVPPEDKEGSVCSTPSKSKLTTAQLAGIIVASAVVGLVIIATIIYISLSKNLKAKIFFYSMKSRVSMKSLSKL